MKVTNASEELYKIEFEKWATQEWGFNASKHIYGGVYRSPDMQKAWLAWQACWNYRMTMPDRILDLVTYSVMNDALIKYEYTDDNKLQITVMKLGTNNNPKE